ncbi:hypothetical protein HX878_20785 [Pseudomonas veronii]|uniref:hypothetical protein n=1 Tax=Pseudomonas veronii TaxID=76761 RepID=UPI00159FED7A|nr:hypothetical protein [Pseudomonas veronii]NWD57171.1 hypothetical protein [Pseudomonas veronii]
MAASTKPAAGKGKTAAKPASKPAGAAPSAKPSKLADSVAPKKPANVINTVSAYKAYTDDDVTRVDGWSMRWDVIEEEEGFNPRDYNDPDTVAHIRKMADAYKRGEVFPHLWVVIRNGTPYVRDGHCRLRSIALAVSEGAVIGKIPIVEVKGDEIAQADLVLTSQDGQKLKPLERAVHYAKYRNWGFTDAAIGNKFDRTGEHVRLYLSMLEFPIALKKLITDGTIKPTLALELYKQYGSDSVDLVNQAAEAMRQEMADAENKENVAGIAALLTGDLLDGTGDENKAATAPAEQNAELQTPESKGAEEPPVVVDPPAQRKVQVTKKHVQRVAGVAPKLSKQAVASMTRSFNGLSHRIDTVKVIDEKFFIEVTAEDLALLKELKAQLDATPEVPPSDPNQLSILEESPKNTEEAVA